MSPPPDESSGFHRLLPLPDAHAPRPFDPDQTSALIRRGLDRILADEHRPLRSPAPNVDPSDALLDTTLQLGQSLLARIDAFSLNRRITFTKEQRLLALACLAICAHANEPPSPSALQRLGAITDLVADENRFWWWNALPLQLALNVIGEGNGGYRTLYGNLTHPHDALRLEMIGIGWIVRQHLLLPRLATPLLANIARTETNWAESLALLRATSPDDATFLHVVEGYEPASRPERYWTRIADLADPESPLRQYLATPQNLLALEAAALATIPSDLSET